MSAAAREAGVAIVTGDTKVLPRSKADGVFINTAGVGMLLASWPMGQAQVLPGDKVLLSGPVGDHGITVMLARESLEIETERAGVRGACEILGLDLLTIANEGKLLAIVVANKAEVALQAMRSHSLGREATIIGEVRAEPPGMVFLRTDIGGTRVLDILVGDPLPRIC